MVKLMKRICKAKMKDGSEIKKKKKWVVLNFKIKYLLYWLIIAID